jgi:hypothetical protein
VQWLLWAIKNWKRIVVELEAILSILKKRFIRMTMESDLFPWPVRYSLLWSVL